MKTQELRLYELLKVKIGEEETQLLLEAIEMKSESTFESKVLSLATKEDLLATRQDISVTKAILKEDIANTKAEIIKWLFVFWLGQMASTIAIVKFML